MKDYSQIWDASKRLSASALVCVGIIAGSFRASAHDVPPVDTNAWHGDISFGLTITGGNSDSVLAAFGFLAERKWQREELRLEGRAAYGKSEGDYNANSARLSGQYNHLFTDQFYGSVRADAIHDDIAEVSYRLILSPAAGYYFIKNDRTRLNGEFGPAFIYERVQVQKAPGVLERDEHGYVTLRFSERWEQKLSDTAKFWEQVDYFPQVDDFTGNFLINAEVGIEVAINSRLALRSIFTWKFDNEPPPDRRSYDIASITSIVYKY